jgi:Hint domain
MKRQQRMASPTNPPPPLVPPTGPAWFRAGTGLMTLRGEIPVEQVRVGDQALTLSGEGAPLKPVEGVAQLIVDLDAHPAADQAAPIRVRAGAIEDGMPIRDLVVSPGHAVALEDADGRRVLVPVVYLANGATILREPPTGLVTYVQLGLDAHDIVMADGMAAEGARHVPQASPTVVKLRPSRAGRPASPRPPDLSPLRPDAACAPMLFGPQAAALHARLLARAEGLGHTMTDDPALVLLAGGVELPPLQAEGGEYVYLLPPGTGTVRLRSRTRIPMELDPECGDPRRLGVALACVLHDGAAIALDSPAFAEGFLPPESGATWRWTGGDAVLALQPVAQETTLELHIHLGWGRYWLEWPPVATA